MEKRPVKLCVITTVPITVQVFLLDQLIYLADNGFIITIVCDDDPDFNIEWPHELEYYPVSMKRNINLIGTMVSFIKLLRFLKKRRFDMVQYTTPKASFLSAIASRMAGIPIRIYCQWGMRYVGLNGVPRKIFKQIEKITCYFSTNIIPDSFGNLSCAIEDGIFPAAKGSVIGKGSANGVNLQKFDIERKAEWRKKTRHDLDISDEAFMFGFVGRITRDKGIGELVKAFNLLHFNNKNTCLLLVGPRDKENGLETEIIELLDRGEGIYELGYQNNPNVFIAACDIIVLPSYREGFGVVAIEAQALGIPVITTDIPGPREAIVPGKTGVLVPPGDSYKLQMAMYDLMTNNFLLKSMGQQGFDYVRENFEQSMFWSKVLEHRRSLADKQPVKY